MQHRVVRQFINGTYPHLFLRRQFFARLEIDRLDVSEFKRSLVGKIATHFRRNLVEHTLRNVSQVLQALGSGDVRHRSVVFEPFFGILKRRSKIQDWPAMLNRNNPPVGKTAAIPGPIHLVDNRGIHVATPQEIGMQ